MVVGMYYGNAVLKVVVNNLRDIVDFYDAIKMYRDKP